MKSLIVLAAFATLLASTSGCSMFRQMGAQPCKTCDTTSSEPLLSRIRLPSISLPWNRAKNLGQGAGCNACSEGFSESNGGRPILGGIGQPSPSIEAPGVGPSDGWRPASGAATILPQGAVLGTQVYDGQIIDGQVIDGGTVVSPETLYHPEVVGPVSAPNNYTTRYAGELIPTPVSPAVDLGK